MLMSKAKGAEVKIEALRQRALEAERVEGETRR